MNGNVYELADNSSVSNFFRGILDKGLEIIPDIINPKSATQQESKPAPGGKGVAVEIPASFFQRNKTPILIGAGVLTVGLLGLAVWKLS